MSLNKNRKTLIQKLLSVTPYGILFKMTSPILPGIYFINVFFQRILRINADQKFMVHFTSRVVGDVTIAKSSRVSLAVSGSCYLQGNNGIIIGEDTLIAPNVSIISANHDLEDRNKWAKATSIEIGDNCWIGTQATILPTVKIGSNCIIGAGAVVTKNIPDNSTVVGNPAKIIHG